MEFSYKKNDSQKLFKSLEDKPEFGISQPQNYIPLYDCFFSLSQTNHNSIGLNNTLSLTRVISQETTNIFKCNIKENGGGGGEAGTGTAAGTAAGTHTKKVFLKFSPLLDPLKYLIGKYDIDDPTLLRLPSFDASNSNIKARCYNNAAYVDSFFTYLSSKLLHDYGFIHGLDFYGSFLALKKEFQINIIDDIEYLNDSAFFRKYDKILYELVDIELDETDGDTRNYKKKLQFGDDTTILQLSDLTDLTQIDAIVNSMTTTTSNGVAASSDLELITLDHFNIEGVNAGDKNKNNKTHSSHGTCSSRTSNTTDDEKTEKADAADADADEADEENDEEEDEADEEKDDQENSDSDDGSSDDEETLIAKIKQFPVQVIALEHCENTLDYLMSHGDDITNEMWDSIVVQILFSLITFQKTFNLTHNDLHTNNVMYVETDKPFVYYKLNHIYYKVPTFGKLIKIIDFGRAIYKFRGQILCSDSFHPDGDAATQYNCEPYFNGKKPRLEPNYSFDLCRLGCALYDYLADEPKTKIVQIMLDWILDDKGRNVLYKKNGDERYPDFKLYKMIARTVNKHVPMDVLSNAYFDKFIINKKQIKKKTTLMDLDAIPYLG